MAVLGTRDAAERRYQQVLNDQAESVLLGVKEKLGGETDKDAINSIVEKMHQIDNGYFYIQKV